MQDIIRIEPIPFTESDWHGFAGATKFPNGDQPFTAQVFFEDAEALLVCGAEGAEIYSEDENIFQLAFFSSKSALQAAATVAAMLQCGFEEGSVYACRLERRGLGSH